MTETEKKILGRTQAELEGAVLSGQDNEHGVV